MQIEKTLGLSAALGEVGVTNLYETQRRFWHCLNSSCLLHLFSGESELLHFTRVKYSRDSPFAEVSIRCAQEDFVVVWPIHHFQFLKHADV